MISFYACCEWESFRLSSIVCMKSRPLQNVGSLHQQEDQLQAIVGIKFGLQNDQVDVPCVGSTNQVKIG